MSKSKCPIMTTTSGNPIGDNQNSLTAGERGPLLMQDFPLMEKLAHLSRERIPERLVHAKGSGALGQFTVTHDISKYTKAYLFGAIGRQTDVLVRFSTVAGERGAADAERDVRGFAVKFYTGEGNWDLVGNNTPVFFIRDPYKFPDLVHSQKRHPKNNLRSNTAFWDFLSHSPEALHQITFLMGDRGFPAAPQCMDGFGGHAFSFINDSNERCWVKFHLKTCQGHRRLSDEEAAAIVGVDRESTQRSLFCAIEAAEAAESGKRDECGEPKKFPRWELKVQIMSELDAEEKDYNPFDLTKVWSQKDYPLIDVGVLELNKNPDNYFTEIEQAAFSPANMVPGIGFSPDKVLQGRLFAYADAQRYRLGTHYDALPVNAPKSEVHHYHKDGAMRFFPNNRGDAFYEPNSFGGAVESAEFKEPPLAISGDADRYDHRVGNDDYTQARNLFLVVFNDDQRCRLFKTIAGSMDGVQDDIIERILAHFDRVDASYGDGVRDARKARLALGKNNDPCSFSPIIDSCKCGTCESTPCECTEKCD